LSLDLDKTQWLKLTTRKNFSHDIQIAYKYKLIVRTSSTKFLGLIVDDTLSWKNHKGYITAKLDSACFAIRAVQSLLSKDALKYTFLIYILSYFMV
jgi:hypothetical protein